MPQSIFTITPFSSLTTLQANHVLLSTDGPYDNVLKVKPPLAFGITEAEHLVATLRYGYGYESVGWKGQSTCSQHSGKSAWVWRQVYPVDCTFP